MRRRLARLGLRLLGPALLVVLIARYGDLGAILRTLRDTSAAPLLLAIALNGVNLHFKVVRWDVLLRTRGIRYPRRRIWGAYLASGYLGSMTPGRVGDALRAHYLHHELGTPYAEGMASVVMDRVCDLYVLVGFVALGVVRFSSVVVGRL